MIDTRTMFVHKHTHFSFFPFFSFQNQIGFISDLQGKISPSTDFGLLNLEQMVMYTQIVSLSLLVALVVHFDI